MSDAYDEFEKAESGASATIPASAGSIKKGGHMVISGKPCKVMEMSTAKTGKHGHAKANITGIDIFTGKKYEDSVPVSHGIEVPSITRTEWMVVTIDDEGYVTLMSPLGETRADLKLPSDTSSDNELSERLKSGVEEGKEINVTVLSALGIEKISEMKEAA